MKNSDMPAMPLVSSSGYPVSTNNINLGADNMASGLTKREHFAAMAMQGLLASDTNDEWQSDNLAAYAVKCADALLEELSE